MQELQPLKGGRTVHCETNRWCCRHATATCVSSLLQVAAVAAAHPPRRDPQVVVRLLCTQRPAIDQRRQRNVSFLAAAAHPPRCDLQVVVHIPGRDLEGQLNIYVLLSLTNAETLQHHHNHYHNH